MAQGCSRAQFPTVDVTAGTAIHGDIAVVDLTWNDRIARGSERIVTDVGRRCMEAVLRV